MSKQKIEALYELSNQLYGSLLEDEFLKEDCKSQEIMKNVMKNLKERRFVVSVIAAMKAGKSTTFNALLGRDILPNENASCTAAVTEIKHSKEQIEVVQKVYKDGNVVNITSSSTGTLEENFHLDVRSSRKNDEVKAIEKYFLETPVSAIDESEYSDLVQNFILVDTPGPNEANVGDFDVTELQKIALEKLRHSDALIMLFDYQNYKSDTNATILKSIFENREDLENDQEKIYFLINKIDTMTAKDGSVEDVINNVQTLIREYAPVIKEPKVFAFSAKKACLARSFIKGNMNDGAIEELRKYAINYETTAEINGKTYRIAPEPEEYVHDLLDKSNILHIEKNIIERMFYQASNKMLENAYERIQQVTQNVSSLANAQIEISTQNESELVQNVNESKKKIEDLRNETEKLKKFTREHLRDLKDETKIVLSGIPRSIEQSITKVMPSESKLEGHDKEQLLNQARSLRNHITESIQFNINREVDKIQRLIIEKQTKINQGLNEQFMQLSNKANEIVGKHITLQFQVFNMEDISIDSASLNVSGKNDIISNKSSGKAPVDPLDNILKNALAGAGTGFGAGIVLPGIGNLAGALVGGVAGLISGIMQNKAQEESQVYFVDLTKMKSAILKDVNKKLESFVDEIDSNIDTVNSKYIEFVEKQMDGFIKNLKNQLDSLLGEFIKNKHNIENHVQHMRSIQSQMDTYMENAEEIHRGEKAEVVC
jgi:hypothetical protein